MVLGESDSLSDADHKFRNGEDMMAAYERVATGKKGNSK